MLKVLVVEDNSLAARMVYTFFRKAAPDTQVDMVETGFDAKSKIAEVESGYDIIMMDFGLPDCNGVNLTRELRDAGVTSMIVGLSGNLDQFTEEERQAAGLNHGYRKPFSISDAEEIIAKYAQYLESGQANPA